MQHVIARKASQGCNLSSYTVVACGCKSRSTVHSNTSSWDHTTTLCHTLPCLDLQPLPPAPTRTSTNAPKRPRKNTATASAPHAGAGAGAGGRADSGFGAAAAGAAGAAPDPAPPVSSVAILDSRFACCSANCSCMRSLRSACTHTRMHARTAAAASVRCCCHQAHPATLL